MRVNQTRRQHLFPEIDNLAGVARLDVIKSANINDPISRNSDRAVLNGRFVHRHNDARANNHLSAVSAVSDCRQMYLVATALCDVICSRCVMMRQLNRPQGGGYRLVFSSFTTLQHSATRRLHASWQSNGTVAGVAAVVGGGDPGGLEAAV